MPSKYQHSEGASELRRRAEGVATERAALLSVPGLSLLPEDASRMVHELEVSQIELEMQNSELERARADLEAAQAVYRDFYNLSPVGYVTVSESGAILEANDTAGRMLGVAAGALAQEPFMRFIHKEDKDTYFSLRGRLMGCGTPQGCELRLAAGPGGVLWVCVAATARLDAQGRPVIRIVLSDITDRKQREERLKESERQYRELFEWSSDALFLIATESGRVVDANQMAVTLYGYERAELLTKTSADLSAEPEETNRRTQEAGSQPGRVFQIPLRLHRKKNGSVFPVSITARSLTREGPPLLLVSCRDITEQKQAEELLQQSEGRFRSLLQSVPSVAVQGYRSDGTTQYWNEASERLYGYKADEAVGRNLLDLIIPPEMREDVRRAVEGMAETGEPIPASELTLMRKDGSRVTVFSCHAIVRQPGRAPELFCLDIDLTERKAAEEALRRSNERHRETIELAVDGILLGTPEGRISGANSQMQKLVGKPLAELLGVHLLDLIAPEDLQVKPLRWDLINDGRVVVTERSFLHASGTRVPLEMHSKRMPDGTYQSICRDVTQRKQAEEALRKSLLEKETLLKEVHHRVKNNLQVISSLVSLQSLRIAHPAAKAAMKDMQNRVRAMALIHEHLYRSEHLAGVDLAPYLRSLCQQLVRALAATPGSLELRLDLAPVRLGIDEAVPCGLLVNELVSNALKHAFPDGRDGVVRVELQVVEEGPSVRLRVADNGVGFPEAFDSTRSESLGLKLVSSLTQQLGGRLEMRRDNGTVFDVIFHQGQPVDC